MQIAGIEIITIEASLLIIVLLIIRHFFADRLHPAVMKWLWGIPALRILLPFQLPLEGLHAASFGFRAKPVLLGLWFIGVIAVFVLFLSRNAGFKRNVKRQRSLYGKKDGLLVYFVDKHIGSCLVGLVHPQIYVSKVASDSLDWCRWIVKHELCHYRAMDHWYGVLRLLCIVLQWFNPLVWYAAACSIEDLEIVCDYRVVKDEEPEAQMSYGKCLIAMASKNPRNLLQSITTGNALGKGSLKRRIERLGETAKTKSITGGLLVIGMLLLLGACMTVPNNSDSSLVSLLTHVPYIKECILHYELEKPSKENLEQTVEVMQYRCRRAEIEDIRILAADAHSLLVLLPPSKVFDKYYQNLWGDDFQEETSYVVYGEALYLHTGDEDISLDVNQDMFSIESDSGGYSLWLDFEQVMNGKIQTFTENTETWPEEGNGLYLGQDYICSITEENVRGYQVRILENMSFENIYDSLERICKKNPCGLNLMN